MVFFVGISEYKKFNVMPRHPNARLIPYFFQFGIRDAKKAVMNNEHQLKNEFKYRLGNCGVQNCDLFFHFVATVDSSATIYIYLK